MVMIHSSGKERLKKLTGLLPDINEFSDEDFLNNNPLNILKALQGLNDPRLSPLSPIANQARSARDVDPASPLFSLSPAAARSTESLPPLPPGGGNNRGLATAGRSLGDTMVDLLQGATTPGAMSPISANAPIAYNAVKSLPDSPVTALANLAAIAAPLAVKVKPAYKGVPNAAWLHEGRSPRVGDPANNKWGLYGQLGEGSYWSPSSYVGEGFLRGDDTSGMIVGDVTMDNPLDLMHPASHDFRAEVLRDARISRVADPIKYSQIKRAALNPNLNAGQMISIAGLPWTKKLSDIARKLGHDAITDLEGYNEQSAYSTSTRPSRFPHVSDYQQMALLDPRRQVDIHEFVPDSEYRPNKLSTPKGQVEHLPKGQYQRSILARLDDLQSQGKPFEDALAQARAEAGQSSLSSQAIAQRANKRLGQPMPDPIDLSGYTFHDKYQQQLNAIRLTREIQSKYGTKFKEAAAIAKNILDEEERARLNRGLRTPIFPGNQP